jgi:D-galactarolactone cycloisomerase
MTVQRRAFLKSAAALTAASPLAAPSPLAAFQSPPAVADHAPVKLKITDIRVLKLRSGKELGVMEQNSLDPPLRYLFIVGGGSFTEIHTDQGLVGIGPGVDPETATLAKTLLLGKDPFDMNDHALRLYNPGRRGGASIEIALWDLIGKAANQPLYKLWGGAIAGLPTTPGRNKVMPYASQWTVGTPEDRVREAQLLQSQGWKAMKLRLGLPTIKEDVALVEAVRKAAGDDFLIMTDANKAGPYATSWPLVPWSFQRAVDTARELHRYNVYWLEEPLPRYDFDQLAELNRMVELPIAGGENNAGVNEYLLMLQKGSFDFVQPEVLSLGPTMARTIAALAAAYNVRIVPHVGSKGFGSVCLLHLIASWPNSPTMEIIHEPPIGDWETGTAIFENPPRLEKDGYITVPDGPGLGVTVKADFILPS